MSLPFDRNLPEWLQPSAVPVARSVLPAVPGGAVQSTEPAYNSQGVFLPQLYGDYSIFPVVFAGAGNTLVLQKPKHRRISLLIQNNTGVDIFYDLGKGATNVSSVRIPTAGNRLFDVTCPQDDVFIFSMGAGTVIIEYCNADIAHA